MTLPDPLKKAIEEELAASSMRDITSAREELTERYRTPSPDRMMSDNAHRLSYLATRLPATYEAIAHVLHEVERRLPNTPIHSIVDMGGGPGTALWAAASVFELLSQITVIENDSSLITIGKRLAQKSDVNVIRKANWTRADFTKLEVIPRGDLTIFSYAIGEIDEAKRLPLLRRCWETTQSVLVVIEPGTPKGFERIRTIRQELIALGGHIIAPCPHANACPMEKGDWCHFAARVERSSFHRKLKGGTLGHEDEKFSYIAVAKSPCLLPEARILRHPQKRTGHVSLTLCTKNGLKQEIVSKRTPESYKNARKLDWGDTYGEMK
jgi:ribosomal protein RSM22 (predicted rRNA methylase)